MFQTGFSNLRKNFKQEKQKRGKKQLSEPLAHLAKSGWNITAHLAISGRNTTAKPGKDSKQKQLN